MLEEVYRAVQSALRFGHDPSSAILLSAAVKLDDNYWVTDRRWLNSKRVSVSLKS